MNSCDGRTLIERHHTRISDGARFFSMLKGLQVTQLPAKRLKRLKGEKTFKANARPFETSENTVTESLQLRN